jgi:hypothetical protein
MLDLLIALILLVKNKFYLLGRIPFFEEDGRQNTKDIKILLEYMVLIEILK